MKIDLTRPLEIEIEKFKLENKKDEINPYMIGKIIRKNYEAMGYTVVQCADFESGLLIEFVKDFKLFDKYIKVKLGEYKKNPKVDDYNKQIMNILQKDDLWKLLFICRLCSYLGDPSFPDIIIAKQGQTSLRYIYSGDDITKGKSFFILLSKLLLSNEIKFSSTTFSDFSHPDKMQINLIKILEGVLSDFSKREDPKNPKNDTGIDLNLIRKWIAEKSVDREDIVKAFNNFISSSSENSKLKENIEKMNSFNLDEIKNKSKPEKLAFLREKLGVNMMEANELLILKEIIG